MTAPARRQPARCATARNELYITASHVREQRRRRIGSRGWTEDGHYAGVTARARW
ncbi:MAG: hypothetical protein JJU18_02195 [Oceanicaulis sp.]|nr:hypothetical protein [Oceanicaulis sp.]